jgi:hypothetical protein
MVTSEIRRGPVRRTDVTVRTAAEARRDERAARHRAEVALKVTAVTLAWLVSVSLLVGWSLTVRGGAEPTNTAAAVLTVVLPFVGAVIATRNRQFVLGGVYVVLTLLMVLPALGIIRAGG